LFKDARSSRNAGRGPFCGETICPLGMREKIAVRALRRELRCHSCEHCTSSFSLMGMGRKPLKMESVLLNLKFQMMQCPLGIE
jgi:hypothetical protein